MNSNDKRISKRSLKAGDKFGRLTVISYTDRKGKRGEYKCICECGNITYASTYSLKTGRHSSCGCLMKEKQCNRMTKPNNEAVYNFYHRSYRRSAKVRNYEFNLTVEDVKKIVTSNCVYCGSEPLKLFADGNRRSILFHDIKVNGIDRVDNNKGYILENVVTACYICNNSKNILTCDEWMTWIEKIYKYQFKKNENNFDN